MGLLSKVVLVAGLYYGYKIISKKEYEEIRKLLYKSFTNLKPLLLNFLETYEFEVFGYNHIDTAQQKINTNHQIQIIRKMIDSIDAEQFSKTALNFTKEAK